MSTAIAKKAKGSGEAKPDQLIQSKIGKGQIENNTHERAAMQILEIFAMSNDTLDRNIPERRITPQKWHKCLVFKCD